MGEEGREGGSTQQQPDVGPLYVCGYSDIVVLWRYVLYLQVLVKIDRCIGVWVYIHRRSIMKKIIK